LAPFLLRRFVRAALEHATNAGVSAAEGKTVMNRRTPKASGVFEAVT